MIKNSKQRAYLKGLAMNIDPIIQIGKMGYSPALITAVEEAFNTHELIKLGVLQNCVEDPKELARLIAERTHSDVVIVIGKKIVLYKEGKDKNKKIELPR